MCAAARSIVIFVTICASLCVAFDISHVVKLNDFKEFKKLLRVKTNVLVLFFDLSMSKPNENEMKKVFSVCSQAGKLIWGYGTIAQVNCQDGDGKKLCKKLKIYPKPFDFKHYHNGEFHKDYDRPLVAKNMYNFLLNPTGDIPWNEDSTAVNVVHLENRLSLLKHISNSKKMLIMFYAPWCAHCKSLKPEFSAAADHLNGKVVLAAVDVTQPGNEVIANEFDIRGYPTLEYFENGVHKFRYKGQNSKAGIIEWLKNPVEDVETPEEETPWAEVPSEVVHLSDDSFDTFMTEHKDVLVMFYAPWCGHCKKVMPDYMLAAKRLKLDEVDGVLAAVDSTVNRKVAEKNNVEGFPTFAYFSDGKFMWNVNERTEDGFYNFMKNPKLPPPLEVPWRDEVGNVVHLNTSSFKLELKRKKTALVMFYAPWCGHCKKVKPKFTQAADVFEDDPRILFAAVDCTEEKSLCQEYKIQSFPSFVLLSYGKNRIDYLGVHEVEALISFVRSGGQSDDIPKSSLAHIDFGDSVVILDETSFYEYVGKDKVIVMFYSPGCDKCKVSQQTFSKAAEKLGGGKFSAIDCNFYQSICKKEGVETFPTFKIFNKGIGKVYSDEYTTAEFIGAISDVDVVTKMEL